MGKRKSKRKPPPKQKRVEALTVTFACPFCSHDHSCEVKMFVQKMLIHKILVTSSLFTLSDRKTNTGTIECRICKEKYSTTTHCK